MIIESVQFAIVEGREQEFEQVMTRAREVIGRAKGFGSLEVPQSQAARSPGCHKHYQPGSLEGVLVGAAEILQAFVCQHEGKAGDQTFSRICHSNRTSKALWTLTPPRSLF